MKAEQRIEKVRQLLKGEGLDAIVVRSTTDLQWLTGFEGVFDTEQAHTAVITAQQCVIHTDSRYSTAMKTAAAVEGLWHVSAQVERASVFVERVLEEEELAGGTVAIDAATPLNLYRAFVEALPRAEFAERDGDILILRAVKDAEEVARLKVAQAIAEAAFLETLEKTHAGMTEAEVSLILEMAMRSRGAEELAFANIVASGPNSANPHAIPGQRKLQEGDLVVFDFGARRCGYRSDTTRTVCIGSPSEQQRRIYDAVRLANETVEAALKPGMAGIEAHNMAEAVLAAAGFEGKMGHGLGHGVGLDIHELPNLNTRNDRPLPVGAIVTVEPGVYLSGQDGVRLEDYGQITETGFDNFNSLTHDLICL